jgi:DMSO/TMAO reductase YedYZ molybdopterin-dependent catalytic subunit
VFYAADGYSTALDLSILQRNDALLAYDINGEALSPAHGYPLRLIVPGWYGFKMPKWITRIRFIAEPYAGYWERRGWTTEMLRTRATIHMPHHGAKIRGTIAIQGIAVAGGGGISGVEVRVDHGAWMDAQLRLPDSPGGWTQWYVHWTPPASGGYLIEVRAHDRQGDVQGMHDGDDLHRIVLYADLPTDDD